MFNNSFYPTPKDMAVEMLKDIDWDNINEVLEPSAGKGDLVEAIINTKQDVYRRWGKAQINVDTIESDPNLISILKGKELHVIANDFLTFHTYKKYDAIIMNPPFANGDLHLMKAIEVMERYGGLIICLLNAETIKNPYSNSRKALSVKLEELGAEISYYQKAFANAERRTNVEIALVKIKIPTRSYESTILNELRKSREVEEQSGYECTGIVVDDVVKAAVAQYEFEVAAGIKFLQEYKSMSHIMSRNLNGDGDMLTIKINGEDDNSINYYIKCVRKKYWSALFKNEKFTRLLTQNLCEKYLNMVDKLVDYDFSPYNIYSIRYEMSKEMCGSLEETILNLFDEFSHKYSYIGETSKNIHYYNGWKTNDAFKINKKVIIPLNGWWDVAYSWGRFYPTQYDVESKLRDIEKVFNYLNGHDAPYNQLSLALQEAEKNGQTKKIHCAYFDLTFYKKGTLHIEFHRQDLLDKFNIFGSQKKGWLPPSYGYASYENMSQEEQAVIDEFQGKEDYQKVYTNKEEYLFSGERMLMLTGN